MLTSRHISNVYWEQYMERQGGYEAGDSVLGLESSSVIHWLYDLGLVT